MNVPAHFKRQIDEAVARYRAWKGGDETVAFTFVTDVHSCIGGISDPPDYRDMKMHIPLMLHTADLCEADFVADLGDQDFETSSLSVANFEARVKSTQTLYSTCTERPVLFCAGNHDYGWPLDGSPERPLPSEKFAETFCKMSSRLGFKIAYGTNPSWGYYDIEGKKTRVFFLNSSDTGYYGFSKDQLEFFVRNVNGVADGWTILVLHHFTPLPGYENRKKKGKAPVENPKFPRQDTFAELLFGLAAGSSGGFGDVTWDFRGLKGRDVRFAGCICGDAHVDQDGVAGDVPYAVSQGYGKLCWEYPQTLRDLRTVRYEFFDCAEQVLFEIVALKPQTRELHIFRVGAGGAKRDRDWRF